MFVEGAGEVDVDQLPVVQSQTENLTRKLEVVQMIRIDRGVAVGLKSCTCEGQTSWCLQTKLQVVVSAGKIHIPSADCVNRA